MRHVALWGLLVLGALLGLGGCVGCGAYNALVEAEETVNRAWSDLESAYQRRSDLVPNLVETVRGFAAQEREVLLGVAEARSRVGQLRLGPESLSDPEAVRRFQEAQAQLSGALSRLLVVAEQYPQLRSSETFLTLMAQLEGTENRINVARQRYNEAVQRYNTLVRRFPTVLVAAPLGFRPRLGFEAQAGAEVAPRVRF
ncbi:MAG: LemA family protein [Bacteroidota bacterium]|nr:LemA family protein [Rhodothermia bacterium]MCS7155171.1 LemA family protein [Bacteroidota bacterium]MDW8138329.1 LemA family protein [Bacteroidota bacterium]MDW8286014.1 LemA family protein [Bacteroidota bacterium]